MKRQSLALMVLILSTQNALANGKAAAQTAQKTTQSGKELLMHLAKSGRTFSEVSTMATARKVVQEIRDDMGKPNGVINELEALMAWAVDARVTTRFPNVHNRARELLFGVKQSLKELESGEKSIVRPEITANSLVRYWDDLKMIAKMYQSELDRELIPLADEIVSGTRALSGVAAVAGAASVHRGMGLKSNGLDLTALAAAPVVRTGSKAGQ
jgi:hypothetical protein